MNCADGAAPQAGLIMDAAGNLYGTTAAGGDVGQGVVFRLASDGTETVLYSFCPQLMNCADGAVPRAGLIMDAAGNLYGTASNGGDVGKGVVFELSPDPSGYTESVLYSFCPQLMNCADGAVPLAGLVMDGTGNLYSTTSAAASQVAREGRFWGQQYVLGGSQQHGPIEPIAAAREGQPLPITFS